MASTYTKSLIKTFVSQYGTDIVNAITDTGLFFPAVVGQLSVESTNGTSGLATDLFNFGGIKGTSSNGVAYDTSEFVDGSNRKVKQYFRKFENFPAFMEYYVSNLKSPNYIDAGVFSATSPEQQIIAMVDGGYSTRSANDYMAGGVQDRINACRDVFPGLSRIYSQPVDNTLQNDLNPLGQ